MNNSATPVQMVDLKAQYVRIKPEIDEAIARVVDEQCFINGPDVAALEKEVAAYSEARHCIAVSSGTDALLVSLMALGIRPGDEVITSPYTFFATVGAIARVGAKPVFVDIDPATYNIDADQIAAKVTPRTKAIIPVHLYGQCAEMDPILEIGRKRGISVVEDAAQAIGSEYRGRRVGALGRCGCFSFFPSKNLGGFGDGGAVVTHDAALAERIRCMRGHGSHPKYYHKMIGGNFRLDTIQAAVLRVKLRHLDAWTCARQERAAYYNALLAPLGVRPPSVTQSRHIFNQYVIRVPKRDVVRQQMKQSKIDTEVYYPLPMHLQECFADLGHQAGEFPKAELAAQSSLALPMHPELTRTKQERVVEALAASLGAGDGGMLSRAA